MKPPELRAVIVDDEAPAREVLCDLLSAHSNVKVIGEADSVANAISICQELRPNLVFLDVQLGDGEGFDVLPKLAPVPAIIFVTAYDQFAFRAFEANALDYLLKPPHPTRLANALERIVHQPPDTGTGPYKRDDRIYLRTSDGILLAFVSQISGIEADQNYTTVRLASGEAKMVRGSLTDWEKNLPRQLFIKLSRSLIVNLEKIERVSFAGRDEMDIKIVGFPTTVHLGRKAAILLRKEFGQPNLL
jgi:two-component system LytT family response regulator